MLRITAFFLIVLAAGFVFADDIDVYEAVEHHIADNEGVDIHYVTLGEGPVMLFVHGFPNWWYDWRNQMAAFKDDYKVVAMDTRAYNKSGKPKGRENYTFPHFMGDVAAVINDLDVESVTLVGHDWGAGISWRFAAYHPAMVDKLIIFNLTHPTSYMQVRETGTPQQLASMNYIKMIYESTEPMPGMNAERLAKGKGGSEKEYKRHLKAYQNSDLNSMLDYYRSLYPLFVSGEYGEVPKMKMPVLQFHGLTDRAVDKDGLRDTWNHVEKDYTLVSLPGVGHDPHHDATNIVNSTMRTWMASRK
jgi:pimeloyl-ACP methyl ester carboxylesterase